MAFSAFDFSLGFAGNINSFDEVTARRFPYDSSYEIDLTKNSYAVVQNSYTADGVISCLVMMSSKRFAAERCGL